MTFEAERQQEEYDRQHDRELLDPIREELEAALLEVGVERLRHLLRKVGAGALVLIAGDRQCRCTLTIPWRCSPPSSGCCGRMGSL